MNPSVTARGDKLRAAASDLRSNVRDELIVARQRIPDDASEAAFGPTVAGAASQFLTAWRTELSAVLDALDQLTGSLEQAATNYDQADQQSN